MDEISRQDALRVHDRSRRYSEATNEAVVKAGEVAIRTAMLVNGGAAVSVLAFIGALVRQDGVTVREVAGVSGSLLWFAGGVAAAVLALALSYFTNFCYGRSEISKIFTFEHPYIIDGANTRRWRYWAYAFHLGTIMWGLLSLAAFVAGMFDVHRAILGLAS
jgi:sulfite exporter TauE/SafE